MPISGANPCATCGEEKGKCRFRFFHVWPLGDGRWGLEIVCPRQRVHAAWVALMGEAQ